MNSIPFAMTWELLRRGRWNLLAAVAGAIMVAAMVVGTLQYQGAWIPSDPSMMLLHFAILQVSMLIIGAGVLQSSGNPHRLYALPVKNSTVVTWQLLPAMAAAGALMLASTAAVNACFHLDWPLWGPALFMAAAMAAVQAALWLAEGSAWLMFALAVVAGPMGIWFKSRYGRPFARPDQYWMTLTSAEIGFLLAVAAASFAVAQVAVARNRRGDPPLSWGFLAWLDRVVARTRAAEKMFRSAGHAQSWYEWRQKGYIMPLIVIVILSGEFAVWIAFNRDPATMFGTLVIDGIGIPLVALVAALVVGNAGTTDRSCEIGPFLATRPMTTAGMSRALLKTAAQTVLAGWAIWAAAFVTFAVMQSATSQPARNAEFQIDWRDRIAFLGFPAMTLLASWIVVANGAAIQLTGRSGIFVKVLLAVLATYFGVLLGAQYALTQEGMWLLAQSLTTLCGMAFIAGTIWAFFAAHQRSMIEGPAIYACLATWVVLLAVITVAYWELNPVDALATFVFLIGLAALVVAPLATAPLAMAWNRTR